MQTAELIFSNGFWYFWIPEDIVSDWDPQFVAKLWKAFFTLLGGTLSLSSGYHPQSNGQMRREILEIGPILRTFCHVYQNSWNQFLGSISLYQPAIELTLFRCMLGYQPPLFQWAGNPIC